MSSSRYSDDGLERVFDEDVLISRVVDAEATSGDWEALGQIAVRDPEIWERLAQAQYLEAKLREAVDVAETVAEEVELSFLQSERPKSRWSHRLVRAGGWAAALLMAVLWWTVDESPDVESPSDGAPTKHQTAVDRDSDSIYSEYVRRGLEEGRLVQELPRLVMSTKSTGQEGSDVEVVYMRRLLERVVVDNFFRLGIDDRGHPVSVPVSPAQLDGLESF